MKIAIISQGLSRWGGGIDLLRHITSALGQASTHTNTRPILIIPSNDLFASTYKTLYPVRELLRQIKNGKTLSWVSAPIFSFNYLSDTFQHLSEFCEIVPGGSTVNSQLKTAHKQKADVVLPLMERAPKNCHLPWVGYLPDFQHRHIPGFFSEKEIYRRNKHFDNMLNTAQHIIVNAKTVITDAENFFPGHSAKIHALPFSPCPQKHWLASMQDARSTYQINAPYFMIANQFWKHKDHETAFRAFAHYLDMGGNAQLICTGQTADYRFPDYFTSLTDLIVQLGICNSVKILGHIPKPDQISLLKNSLAVIQPTLFEGGPGGGAAYDAISLGIPVIASDIPVNLEINCGNITYFSTGEAKSLADAMLERGNNIITPTDPAMLWKEGVARRKQCGDAILEIARNAINDHR